MTGKCWLIVLCCAAAVLAQEEEEEAPLLLKRPEVYSLNIYSDIKYRFATTLITSRVKNGGTESREVVFDVTLPNEAFITNLTLEENGKIIVGEIKKKEEARKQYQAAQKRGESAGYIGTKHRETNRFNLAITVAASSKVSFNLTYQELLQRKHGHYEQVIYIDPGMPVPEMEITVKILESRNITKLKVPPLRNDIGANLIVLDSLTFIDRPTPKSALIKFFPSVEQQKAQSESGMSGQFVVQYDVERSMDAGDILVSNGYFVHFFAPEGLEPIPNDVLFILDNSGSMGGKKLQQLKEAMHSILTVMNEGDRINIMTFSGSTFLWQQKMMDIVDEDNLEDAKIFVDAIVASGSTNINLALTSGLEFLTKMFEREPKYRSRVIVFLTDGQATSGVTIDNEILENIRNANTESDVSIFSLAFGAHADFEIVKKVAIQNNGFGKRIYEASDAALQIAGFYNEISMTLLKNLTFQYLDAPVSNLTNYEYENYFNGSEMVICGRLLDSDNNTDLNIKIESRSLNGPNILLMTNTIEPELDDPENLTKLGDYEKITEKVWAYLTIKQLLEQELATSNRSEKLELNRRILDLSLSYDFVTPLTSMVVTKDDKTESTDVVSDDTPQEDRSPMFHGGMHGKSVAQSANVVNGPVASIGYKNAPTGLYSLPMLRPVAGRNRYPHPRPPPQHHPMLSSDDEHSSGPSLPDLPTPKRKDESISRGKKDKKDKKGKKDRKKSKERKDKKNKKGNSHKRKNSKELPYPLKVTLQVQGVDESVCYTLFTDKMRDGNEYLLYAENGSLGDVKLHIQLETFGKKKNTVGGIKRIMLYIGNVTHIIESDRADNVLINTAKTQKVFTTKLDGFELSVASAGVDFVNIAIHSVNYDKMSTEGILGSILSKKIKETRKKGLQLEKVYVKAKHRSTVPFGDSPSTECMVAQNQAVFYDLQQFKH